jgi:photosystem II stability/assembly factor-like uncharacterized protein
MKISDALRAAAMIACAVASFLPGARTIFSQSDAASDFFGMRWRMIGPFRGGRTIAVTGVPGHPNEFLFGAAGGGIWKTENAGGTWQPIFNGPISSIGSLAVATSEPGTIYAGTGEADMDSDISFGDGVYKSTDGGVTWRNIGLTDSRHIGTILVDPHNANLVLVAALGHAFGPNPMRGVFRSTDGGAHWQQVLHKDDDTGAIDLCFDPGDPHVVYASLWQTRQFPWSAYAPINGVGSGLYKSADEGVTWKQITGGGFPQEQLGRIGIAVAPGGKGTVYALVDARDGGIYRSDDAGLSWHRVSSDHSLWQRGWYFGSITADPRNPNIFYVANTSLYLSANGGWSFAPIKGVPGGDNYHSLWISPEDSTHMIVGSDQGATVTVDGGRTWSSWYNQPTAQFYHVITDDHFPYRVYGPQQGSGTAAVLSRSDYGQISFRDWMPVGGGESGYIVPDADGIMVYGGGPFGAVGRFDRTTGQSFDISPWRSFASGDKFRWPWAPPLVASTQNPGVLYLGAQYVLQTNDRGMSWHVISPDLTVRAGDRNNATRNEPTGGSVSTIAPSPFAAGEIWAGTDNGIIQLTSDNGKSWTDVTPAGLAEWSMVSLIDASRLDAATAFAAFDCHQVDDFHPYIYRTHDSGKHWQAIVAGLPDDTYVHAVREDTVRKGLLFAGTEAGVYVSFDDGDHWQSLELNLPSASVRDLTIHGDDLVIATYGRSFWILDDISPLRQWNAQVAADDVYLFEPADAIRVRRSENHDTPLPPETPVGENPPTGAILDYRLKAVVTGEVALEILDADGNLVRRFSSDSRRTEPPHPMEFPPYWIVPPQYPSKNQGLHRFIWDLRYSAPAAVHYEYSKGAIIGREATQGTVPEPQGPLALPGKYTVRLIVRGKSYEQPLTIHMDPRVQISARDLKAQLDLATEVSASLSQATTAYLEIEQLRQQLSALESRVKDNGGPKELAASISAVSDTARSIAGDSQEELPYGDHSLRQLDDSMAKLAIAVESADCPPTAQAFAEFADLGKQLDKQRAKWDILQHQDVALLNRKLEEAGIPALGSKSTRRPDN